MGGVLSLSLISKTLSAADYIRKPSSFQLGGGSISNGKVKAEFDAYTDSYGKDPAQGIKDRCGGHNAFIIASSPHRACSSSDAGARPRSSW